MIVSPFGSVTSLCFGGGVGTVVVEKSESSSTSRSVESSSSSVSEPAGAQSLSCFG